MFYSFNKQIVSFAASKYISLIPNKLYFKINNSILNNIIKKGRICEFSTDIGVSQPHIDLIRNKYAVPNIGFLHKEKQLETFKHLFNDFNAFQHHEDWNGEIDLYMLESGDERPITEKWLPILEKN
jgi:hypothetical protein